MSKVITKILKSGKHKYGKIKFIYKDSSLEILHNDNGPAVIQIDNSGNKVHEQYFINGLLHRLNGPADVSYHNGNILTEDYYEHGFLSRENGPATIYYRLKLDGYTIEYIQYGFFYKGKDCKSLDGLTSYVKLLNIS